MRRSAALTVLLLCLPQTGLAQQVRVRTDLDSIVALIHHVHPAPWRRTTASAFDSEAAALRRALPRLSGERAVARMMHLVASLHDGHTTLLPSAAGGFDRWLPLRFYRFTDGVYITAIDTSMKRFAGARVLRVGRLVAAAALDSAGSLQGYDNPAMRAEVGLRCSTVRAGREPPAALNLRRLRFRILSRLR